MFIQQMCDHTYAADNGVVAVQESQDYSAEKKNDDFYDFQSDDEAQSQGSVEIEVNDYLNNARTIESLYWYPVVKRLYILHNTRLGVKYFEKYLNTNTNTLKI